MFHFTSCDIFVFFTSHHALYTVLKHCENIFFGCFRLKYFHEADFARFHVQATCVLFWVSNQRCCCFLHLDGSVPCHSGTARPMGIKPNLHWVSWHSKVGKLEIYLKLSNGVDEKMMENMFRKDAESKIWFRIFFCKGNLHSIWIFFSEENRIYIKVESFNLLRWISYACRSWFQFSLIFHTKILNGWSKLIQIEFDWGFAWWDDWSGHIRATELLSEHKWIGG